MRLTSHDKCILILFCGLCPTAVVLGWVCWDTIGAAAAVGGVAVVFSVLQVTTYRHLASQIDARINGVEELVRKTADDNVKHYRQTEGLFGLYAALAPAVPLPPMRDYAISPDFACLLISAVKERRPALIVETGSGVSTLILAYCLRRLGGGRIVALEHDEAYAARGTAEIERHGLSDVARVIRAPLIPVKIEGREWRWYDPARLTERQPIEMLVVDGPPAVTQEMARYPALPLLRSRLADDVIVVVDDHDRDDERRMVKLWLTRYPGFEATVVNTEKGAAILRCSRATVESAGRKVRQAAGACVATGA